MTSFVNSSCADVSSNPSPGPRVLNLHATGGLRKLERKLVAHFLRKWPTRYKAICPPAFAALVPHRSLELPWVSAEDERDALVVRLPADFAEKLQYIAANAPAVLVHPDADFVSQQAYFSWTAEASMPPLRPATFWISASSLFEALTRACVLGWSSLAVVVMAGNEVCHFEMPIHAALLGRVTAALSAAKLPSPQPEMKVLKKAVDVVANYSKTPWLFLRYEVKNLETWMAVNYAPICRSINGALSDF